jgi:hypothetical protein
VTENSGSHASRKATRTVIGKVAIVLSLMAIGLSAYVLTRLPDEAVLRDLEDRIADHSQALDTIRRDVSAVSSELSDTTLSFGGRFASLGDLLGAMQSDISSAQVLASEAQSTADGAMDRAEEVAVDLGFCLYVEFENYRYWYYYAGGGFPAFTEYVTHCEYQ